MPELRDITFGHYTVAGSPTGVRFRQSPLQLDHDARAILVALIRAAGAPVSVAALTAILAATSDAATVAKPGRDIDAGELWARVAALNTALDACSPDAGYVAHFPGDGFALMVPQRHGQAPPRQGLPARVNPVIGCDDVVKRLGAHLVRHRFVTIVGAGGLGKTTVATMLAQGLAASFRDGVCYVDLAPLADPQLLPNVVASALGVAALSGGHAHALAAYLRDKHMLLLLDSCEHVVAAAAGAAEHLLRAAPALHVLTTSREPLLASGEWLYRLEAMRLPPHGKSMGAMQAMQYPAVQLFAERAGIGMGSGPGIGAGTGALALDDAGAALVCAICHRLDGIPLAIELAAARVRLLGLAGLAEQLEHRLLSTVAGRDASVARHRTLGTMLDWSYDLLPPHEQVMLVRLALFRGEFTLAAAVALLAGEGDAVASSIADSAAAAVGAAGLDAAGAAESVIELVSKSLVARRDASSGCRYRLLDTTRAYAGAKLDASGERRVLLVRYARYLIRLFSVAERDWLVMSRGQWLDHYTMWIDDIRVLLDWAFSADGDTVLGMELAVAAFPLGHQASLTVEFGERIEWAMASSGSDDPVARLLKIQMHALLCNVHFRTEMDVSDIHFVEAAALEADATSPLLRYRTALATGLWATAFVPGDFPASLERCAVMEIQAVHGADAIASLVAKRVLSQSLHFLGRHREAGPVATHVLDYAWRKIPLAYNPSQIDVRVSMRIVLARIAWMEGRADQARALAGESAQHAVADTAVALAQALALCCVPVALWCGDADSARAHVDQLALHARRYSLNIWTEWALRYRDVLAARAGDALATQRLLAPASSAFDNMQRDHMVTFDPRLLAPDSEARVGTGMVGWCAPELLRGQAERQALAGQDASAEALLRQSLALSREQCTLAWELRAATSLARLWQRQGRGAEAGALLAPVLARFAEGHDTRDLREASALLAAL